jgi:hypothetical protein
MPIFCGGIFSDGNGSFFQERQFSTRTTKISAFRSNGRKKDHMEVAGIYIAEGMSQ